MERNYTELNDKYVRQVRRTSEIVSKSPSKLQLGHQTEVSPNLIKRAFFSGNINLQVNKSLKNFFFIGQTFTHKNTKTTVARYMSTSYAEK